MGEWCSTRPTRPGQTWPDAIISPELVCGPCRLSQSLARMTLFSSLLLSSLSLHTVLGVITNQGPRWPVEDDEDVEDNEVREFTGWIQGRPEDYIMNLQRQQHRSKAQSNTRKTAVGPKLNLFSPGIKNDYEYLIKKQNEVANFTYKKGECI